MQVRILGSGAADGWPNPWCSCLSCEAAREQGVLRGNTSVLVDGKVLIDFGPDGLRAAAGISLRGVQLVLVTHSHADHWRPSGLQWRAWAEGTEQVTLLAPPTVLAMAGGDAQVTPIEAHPGASHEVAGYTVRVLDAEHPGDAVLFDLTCPDGARLLYATDTGVLPQQTVEGVADRAYDVVLLELTGTPIPSHLTLDQWPQQIQRLRAVGAVTGQTHVRAIHVGHHNPPPDELDRLLQLHEASAARDGQVIDTARGHRVLVLGGQSSGKSAFAENLMHGDVTYVATAAQRPDDDDWAERVRAHRARRPASWTTLETQDLVSALHSQGRLLIDDLGLWLTHVLDDHWDAPTARPTFDQALGELLEAWQTTPAYVVLVSSEVGSGVIAATASGRLFTDLLGKANTALAGTADEVFQVVAGQPRRLR